MGERAALFASVFGCAELARVAGRLHDIGKASAEYQRYISMPRGEGNAKGPDHSTAGAREAARLYPGAFGRALAYAIAGHHAGLADAAKLDHRLSKESYPIKAYDGWAAHAGPLADGRALQRATPQFRGSVHGGFTAAFLTRMLFSCLVDADFLETEAFYARATGVSPDRGGHASVVALRDRLRAYMAAKRSDETPLNRLRGDILDHAIAKAALAPGLFTLTVPTGGGKTLASLSFALEHAARHGLERVIHVIPYTSIIEQTAQVFREALATDDDVLEHHATFDWDEPEKVSEADDEGASGLAKLRKTAENWDVPIIVTTAVQFYESLFAARTSRCRKLHNMAKAVIVLDEAQTLPVGLLKPCLATLDELARNYGSSVVVCTATQPAWRLSDAPATRTYSFGLDIPDARELAPRPPELYERLRRVRAEVLGETTDGEIAARFADQERMLCVVNSRAHAQALFAAIHDRPGATHLTTLMCPRHRRAVLADVRQRLANREPVRLVATSLIEAGVDVDFPEVWRAEAGLDSIVQAAGRCNREGRLEAGRLVVFTPAQAKTPRAFRVFQDAARATLRRGFDDILGLDAIQTYFNELYWQHGEDALDAAEIDGREGVLRALSEGATRFAFPFRSIADAFRLIDEVMEPVIVPWDEEAKAALTALGGLAAGTRPPKRLLRKLQQYVVSIPRQARDEWLVAGVLGHVHPTLGDGLLAFADLAHYRPETGLDLNATSARDARSNII